MTKSSPQRLPLFAPGIVDVSLEELKAKCVNAFPNNSRRADLFERLECYIEDLARFAIDFTIWVDGSFVTNKAEPGDIDIVLIFDEEDLSQLPPANESDFSNLVTNKEEVGIRYNIDIYCMYSNNIQDRMYWRGCYGFVKETEQAKGIPQLKIEASK